MSKYKQRHIVIFTRYPEPGKAKTRLIPELGAVGAAELHRSIAEKTVNCVRQYAEKHNASIAVYYTGGDEKKMNKWVGPGLSICPQSAGDLGRRMKTAFDQGFSGGAGHVLLMGTDIPEISEDHIHQAFTGLESHDVVIGPSTDGGYWLVGQNQSGNIFSNISWSTPEVLSQTIKLCHKSTFRVHQLAPLTDVDTVDDLKTVLPHAMEQPPYVSVIIPALNEEARIESTIKCAGDAAAEIIVVDGGSSDRTIKKSLAANVKVLGSKKGRAFQQNRGAQMANGKVLLFLHADTRLPPGYVTFIFDTLLGANTIMGVFKFKTSLDTPLMRVFERIANIRSAVFHRPYGDQCFFLKKTVFETVGGFPDVPVAEDLMLVRQLAKLGEIRMADAEAKTSGRRWQSMGAWKTFFVNQMVVLGHAVGIPADTLADFYQKTDQKMWQKNNGKIHENI